MDSFTIITTILGLLIDTLNVFITVFFSLKGTPQSPNVTIIGPGDKISPSPASNSPSRSYIKQKNQKTLKDWFSFVIFLAILSIFILTFINTWKNAPFAENCFSSFATHTYYTIYASVGYTTKLISFSVVTLLLGTIIKNIKERYLPFRAFNIFVYIVSFILFIWFIYLTFNIDYFSVIPDVTSTPQMTNNISSASTFLPSLLHKFSPMIIIIQIIFITYAIIYLSTSLIFNEQKSLFIETNAKILFQKILFIFIPAILIWYWTYVWN